MALSQVDWSWLDGIDPNTGAEQLTNTILDFARKYIPQRVLRERKTTHPWINERIVELVVAQRAAEGTEHEDATRVQSSTAVLEEYEEYISRARTELQEM